MFLDDDENVVAMRETARTVGLTDLIVLALAERDSEATKHLLREALRLLGVPRGEDQ